MEIEVCAGQAQRSVNYFTRKYLNGAGQVRKAHCWRTVDLVVHRGGFLPHPPQSACMRCTYPGVYPGSLLHPLVVFQPSHTAAVVMRSLE